MRFGLGLSIVGLACTGALLWLPAPAQAQVKTVKACQIENAPADCGQGNRWAVDSTVAVPNGAYVHVPDPGCMNDATGQIQKVLQAATVAAAPQLALFSGPIAGLAAGPVGDYLKQQGGDIGKWFSPYAKNGALCAPVAVVVPQAATVLGYRLLAGEQNGGTTLCPPGADCSIGWSRWQAEPQVQKNGSMQAVTAVFMNWANDRNRKARMIVFYTLPNGQQPLTQM